jgi:hypothetical protein
VRIPSPFSSPSSASSYASGSRAGRIPDNAPDTVAHKPADLSGGSWTNLFPMLNGVSAVSDMEAWAAGDYGHIVHYSGGSWSALDPPSTRGYNLSDIQMLSGTSGWIAGGSSAFRYEGESWVERGTGLSDAGLHVDRLSTVSADNVWGTGYDSTAGVYKIVHWSGVGAGWSDSGAVLTPTARLTAISMASATDGWAVGSYSVGNTTYGYALHYNGTSWTPVPCCNALYSVTAVGPSNAWFGAQNGIFHYANGNLTHYDTCGGPCPTAFSGIVMVSPSDGWAVSEKSIVRWDGTRWNWPGYSGSGQGYNLKAVTGIPGGQGGYGLWAVGNADTILRGDNATATWTKQQGGPTTSNLNNVWALSPDDAWAVGDGGTVLHYSGGEWHQWGTTFLNDLYNIRMFSNGDGYAVGNGIIAHCTLSGCTVAPGSQPLEPVYTLAMPDANTGWAVDSGGYAWHKSGSYWDYGPVTNLRAWSIALDTRTHGWAGGVMYSSGNYVPALLEYTGQGYSRWVTSTELLPANSPSLVDMVVAPSGEGWAVGNPNGSGNAILHFSNRTWTLDPRMGTGFLGSVTLGVGGEAWASGCSLYHYVGVGWQEEMFPTSLCIYDDALSMLTTQTPGQVGGWAVGPGGSILKYTAPSGVTPVPTSTPIPTVTPTPTPLCRGERFSDVCPGDYFYQAVTYLSDHGAITGYADGTFRPYNNTTRGQLAKIVVLARGWTIYTPTSPTFRDVPTTDPFYQYIETAYSHNIISGYACGSGCLEFRPGNNVTRGQLSKIVMLAEGWPVYTPATPTFNDVGAGNAFYAQIETAYYHNIISGYTCGPNCLEFRPGATATRGQIAKIVYNAVRM